MIKRPSLPRLTSANAGTAVVQGWEFSYQQRFTFLPGILKGLGVAANYTMLDTHGNFGGTVILGTSQVVGFIPRASPGLNLYRFKMDRVNLDFAYQLQPAVSLTCEINNLFNEPLRLYRGVPDQMAQTIINGTTMNLGLSDRF